MHAIGRYIIYVPCIYDIQNFKVFFVCIMFTVRCCLLQIDMEKVNLDTIKPWITERLNDLLGFEDDVVIEFVFNLLESNQVCV